MRGEPGLMIVSGGQTGVDRAALDAAISTGHRYRGWCPKGGLAEDFLWPPGLIAEYPALRETPGDDPAQRTEWNVRDSDATVIIRRATDSPSPGTTLTIELAEAAGRPLFIVDPASHSATSDLRAFIAGLPPTADLNFAGPRESQAPGIYSESRAIIEEVLSSDAGP